MLTQGTAPVGDTNSTMNVRIRAVVTPTYSFTAVVDILSTAPTECTSRTAFIKLYDRRCSDTMRDFNGAKPPTAAIEEVFVAARQGEHMCKLVAELREDSDEEENDGENEDHEEAHGGEDADGDVGEQGGGEQGGA